MEEKQQSSSQEWNTEYHGVSFIVTLTSSDVMLTLELENADTNERWSGDFTAQYIEDISHRAGSLKKFSVFTKMLSSAFSKESENLSVDILTSTDLEILKASKTGVKPTSSLNVKQSQKRYVILTYTSQFDKSHYPLPLTFEDTPNFPALKRTIARLRRQLADQTSAEKEPSSEKEKELRQMVSQLRQDNTELRHRLRHGGNAVSNTPSNAAAANLANAATAEVVSTNVKLRKQVESLKKELTDSSLAYERLRTESAREIAKWKLKIGAGGGTAGQSSPVAGSPSGYTSGGGSVGSHGSAGQGDSAKAIAELKKKLDLVTKELRFERLSKSQSRTTGWNQNTTVSPARGSASWNNTRASTYSRSNSADANRRSTSAPRTRSGDRGGWETSRTVMQWNTTGIAGRSVSPVVPRGTTSTGGYHSRESTPPLRSRGANASPSSAPRPGSQRSSPAVATSLGGRFDPTAYHRDKLEREKARSGKAWRAGATSSPTTGRYRYQSPAHGESGYASAGSQSSTGSRRSQRSQRSDASSRASSVDSKNSQTKKKSSKKHKKKSVSSSDKYQAATPRSLTKVGASEVDIHMRMGAVRARDGFAEKTRDRPTSTTTAAADSAAKRTMREPQGSRDVAEPSRDTHAEGRKVHASEHRQHRRSRESPAGDSETDDSEFLPPNNTSAHRACATARPAAAVVASPGVSTAYNTYLNAGPGLRKSVDEPQQDDEMRRSHDKLVALAQERSTNLIRGGDDVSDSESQPLRRTQGQGLRNSFEKDTSVTAPHHQSRVTNRLSEVLSSPPRQKVNEWGTTRSGPSPANPVRSSNEGPLSTHVSAPALSAAVPVLGSNTRRSLRRPSDGSTHSALTSSTVGLPTGAHGPTGAGSAGGTSSVRSSGGSLSNMMAGPNNDISEIDKRIQALQSYLDNARTGILAADKP